MLNWLKSLDRVLRGEATSPEAIQSGNIQIPLRGLCLVGLVLAMIYGACMGSFSIFREVNPDIGTPYDRYYQLAATTCKVPALFFLTLAITFPSLYVFNALVGSRLTLQSMLRLLVAALGVNLAVLASLGPIVAFFSVSTTSYHFMLLFNVLVFTVSGTLGLAFLIQTLNRISVSMQQVHVPASNSMSSDEETSEKDEEKDGLNFVQAIVESQPTALDRIEGNVLGRHVKFVFGCWVLVFGLVGAQMGWVLRPFLGDPSMAFTLFRDRESNFFQGVFVALVALFGG